MEVLLQDGGNEERAVSASKRGAAARDDALGREGPVISEPAQVLTQASAEG